MEQYWNRKRIGLLVRGDAGSLEIFYGQYKPVLFTWMYYQVGADAEIAADLTARTFERAIPQAGLFDPHAMTLLQWLREHATAARDEGLLRWQLKPQRPWAWSQLPDAVLNSLAVIRSEPLRNSVAENPFVREIVQASLAEMEQADRELMMHRYSHLDMPDHISTEMDLSVEAVNDLLYRCRHSFRRVFFRLILSVNPGFSESNAAAGIEVLDSNLEKLLRATGMYQVPSDTQEAAIRERFDQAAGRLRTQAQPSSGGRRAIAAVLSGVGLLAVVLALAFILARAPQTEEQAADAVPVPVRSEQAAAVQTPAAAPKSAASDISEEELKLILELGQSGQVEALREFLKSGLYTSQVAAAYFVGKQGVPSDIDLLEAAERQWYANGPANNPFAAAVAEIAARYPDEVRATETTAPPAPAAVAQRPAVKQGTGSLSGSVRHFTTDPAAGAKIEVAVDPLLGQQPVSSVAQAVTDEAGHYQIDQELRGAYFVKCTSTLEGLQSIRQAIWLKNGGAATCDFGGPSVVTGKVGMQDNPVSGLKLMLSDAADPAKAAFFAEAVADAKGMFTFSGVRPGLYRLLSLNENKKLVCLEPSLQIDPEDFVRVDPDLTPVAVTVDYPEPNEIVSATLAHAFDGLYEEKKAGLLGDGSLQFSQVIAGSYLLRLELTSGIRLEQPAYIQPGVQNQVVTAAPPVQDRVLFKGRIIGTAPGGLLLETMDRRVQIPVKVAGDGSLDLPEVPADVYLLTGMLHGTHIVYTSLDLTAPANSEIEMEIDLSRMAEGLGAVYAVVVNPAGQVLAGAVLSLANDPGAIAESTAYGAFLAAPAGRQTLRVEHAGYAPRDIELDVQMPLSKTPGQDDIVIVQLQN